MRVSQASLNRDSLSILDWEDLKRVSLLGRGTYADVYHMIETSSRKQFAVKYLNEKRWEDKPSEEYALAAADLIMEATILSHLDHQHILRLRGIASADSTAATSSSQQGEGDALSSRSTRSASSGGFGGFFLVFDILHETLKDRLDRWRVFAKPPPVHQRLRRQLSLSTGNSLFAMKGALQRKKSPQRAHSVSAMNGALQRKKSLHRAQSASVSDEIEVVFAKGPGRQEPLGENARGEIQSQGSFRRLLRRPSMDIMRRRLQGSRFKGSETDETEEKAETEETAPEQVEAKESRRPGGQEPPRESTRGEEIRGQGFFRSLLISHGSMDQKPKRNRSLGSMKEDEKEITETEETASEREQPSSVSRGLRRHNSSAPHGLRHQPSSESKQPRPITSNKMYARIETVAVGVSSAMNYLHQNHILFRDLKPTNIGFDDAGNVQLFDFGFARHIEDCSKYEVAGTPRYMSPEILRGEGYSFGSDAYSFGLLLSEICTLEVPAAPPTQTHDAASRVDDSPRSPVECDDSLEEARCRIPSFDSIPCSVIKGLIQDCLQTQAEDRPSFATIEKTLRTILLENNDEGDGAIKV
jgi:serine/threonine protein kinase